MVHNVYFWLKKEVTSEQRTQFEQEILKLTQIPYLDSGFASKPADTPERPVTDHSFDYSISLRFKSLKDHDFYQDGCEQHAYFVTNCRQWFERVVVYDNTPLS